MVKTNIVHRRIEILASLPPHSPAEYLFFQCIIMMQSPLQCVYMYIYLSPPSKSFFQRPRQSWINFTLSYDAQKMGKVKLTYMEKLFFFHMKALD